MKKTLLKTVCVVMATLILSACASRKNGSSTISRGKISGKWGITAISLENLLPGNVQSVFGFAPYKCFENSTWELTNSGNGNFLINNDATGCPVGTKQNIYWSFSNGASGPEFQLKKLAENQKPKDVAEGYRLLVTANTGNTMVLKTPVEYGGKTGYVVYSFVRQ